MLLLLAASALGADWLTLAGTELGRKDEPVHLFGFVQPQLDTIVGGELVDEERPMFNRVGGGGAWSFAVRRARLGARGSIPHTDQKVSYYLLAEAGELSITRQHPVVLTDMSATFSYIPGARVRAGQFKLPVMEEIVAGVAPALEFINFSRTLTGLLLENPIGSDGSYTGGAYGFRDVGVMVFDGFQGEKIAGSYAVMASNGSGIQAVNPDSTIDITVRGELAFVTKGERTHGKREEFKVGAWWLQGAREVNDTAELRQRRGAFAHVEQGRWWGLVEVAQGTGFIESGPAFLGAPASTTLNGEAWGAVVSGGARVTLHSVVYGVKGRYDHFERDTNTPELLRRFQTVTAGVEVNPSKLVRLQVNYEKRRLSAPFGSEGAVKVANSLGDRLSAQGTVRF